MLPSPPLSAATLSHPPSPPASSSPSPTRWGTWRRQSWSKEVLPLPLLSDCHYRHDHLIYSSLWLFMVIIGYGPEQVVRKAVGWEEDSWLCTLQVHHHHHQSIIIITIITTIKSSLLISSNSELFTPELARQIVLERLKRSSMRTQVMVMMVRMKMRTVMMRMWVALLMMNWIFSSATKCISKIFCCFIYTQNLLQQANNHPSLVLTSSLFIMMMTMKMVMTMMNRRPRQK